MAARSEALGSWQCHPLGQRTEITSTGLIWEISKDRPLFWANIFSTQPPLCGVLWGKFCFITWHRHLPHCSQWLCHHLLFDGHLGVGLGSPSLSPAKFCPFSSQHCLDAPQTNPEHPFCGAWLTFSRGLPNSSLLALWEGGNGNPRKSVTPGEAGRALPLAFKKILLWRSAQNFSVVLFPFMVSRRKASLWCQSLFVSQSNKLTTLPL